MRHVGVAATNDFSKRWVGRNVTRETMKKVNRVVSRKILTKAGEKSLTSITKLVPVVGAGVGYVFDRSYARDLGSGPSSTTADTEAVQARRAARAPEPATTSATSGTPRCTAPEIAPRDGRATCSG